MASIKRSRISILSALMLSVTFFIFVPTLTQGLELQVPKVALQDKKTNASGSSVFLVVMAQKPILAYEGGIDGLPATRPQKGKKVNPRSTQVRNYDAFLKGRHNAALHAVGAAPDAKVYDYTYGINGFAVILNTHQAAALARQPGVISVRADSLKKLDTDNSPDFLGLTDFEGPWYKGYLGEHVVVGIIDSGIWPEHPSFTDDGSYGPPPAEFSGTGCDFGNTGFNPVDAPFSCNNKLLAAKSYKDGYTSSLSLSADEYDSARDASGHGSFTTSIVAGNNGVSAPIYGVDHGPVSGMAPRARISVYKACWGEDGCFMSDIVMAIDQAVVDGVDIIDFPISGFSTNIEADEIALLSAADAGVFTAVSAGNNGPGSGTISSPARIPWVTAVGASTQNRTFEGSAVLGDGSEYSGASVTASTGVLPLVDAADAGGEFCEPGTLVPPLVAGNIILCKRGTITLLDKSRAVYEAGGAGMILYNSSDSQDLVPGNHWVPTVHIDNTDGLQVKNYISTDGSPAAQINGGVSTAIEAPWMAAFSSRGPDSFAQDIIKPDVTAPGVNILGAGTPTPLSGVPGELFQVGSGTSMSASHVAGIFALLSQVHPDWSPAMARSALMTTAHQSVKKEDGITQADPFDFGSGHIVPGGEATKGSIFQPGLAYDAGYLDYIGFLCDAAPEVFLDPASTCSSLESIGIPTDSSDLNLPSIGIAELVGSQTVVRTVTSVAKEKGPRNYEVSVEAPSGFDVTVSPSSLRLRTGDSATYEVTITNNGTATLGDWAFGSLTWAEDKGRYNVYSPIAVRAVQLDAPTELGGTGTDGSLSFDIGFGYTGDYTAAVQGLAGADKQSSSVVDDPSNSIDTALTTGTGVTYHNFVVPAGMTYARFALFDDYTDGDDDLDLYVWGPSGDFIGSSDNLASSDEQVDIASPVAGTYTIVVHGWETDGPDANYILFNWAFGPDAGNMTVTSAPSSATLGSTGTITINWSGLTANTKYLGAVSHSNGSGMISQTLVGIDTD